MEQSNANRLISVVIVNYHGGDLLAKCVESVLTTTVPVEIYVSDNGSTDESIATLRRRIAGDPRVHITENGQNLGFARASNVVLKATRGDYLLFLNPDCIVHPATLQRMYEVMDQYPGAGMAGCLIRNPDGTEQVGCRRTIPTPWRAFVRAFALSKLFPKNPAFLRDFVLDHQPLPVKPMPVEAISGAFMFVRRQALEQVGPMDEGYFLHCEDLDWCMRFRQAGWQVLFVPDTTVTHYKGHCSKDRPVEVMWHMHKGMVRFYHKFFRDRYPLPLMWLVVTGVWLRFSALVTRELARRAWASLWTERSTSRVL